jgi:hypothetical protein
MGLGGGFLMISPKLRGDVNGSLAAFTQQMAFYAPYSYIGGVVVLLAALMIMMYRGAQPR